MRGGFPDAAPGCWILQHFVPGVTDLEHRLAQGIPQGDAHDVIQVFVIPVRRAEPECHLDQLAIRSAR